MASKSDFLVSTVEKLQNFLKNHHLWKKDTKTKGQAISYADLPAEIRNEIMHHALVVPEGVSPPPDLNLSKKPIYLPVSRIRRILFSAHLLRAPDRKIQFPKVPVPGVSFLVASPQTYAEGHVIFFTENTFYIPYGSQELAFSYFDEMDEETAALIRHLGLRYDERDLTPEILQQAEEEAIDRYHHPQNPSPLRDRPISPARMAQQVDLVMNYHWWKKFRYISSWLRADRQARWDGEDEGELGDLGEMTARLEFPRGRFIEYSLEGGWAEVVGRPGMTSVFLKVEELWDVTNEVMGEVRNEMVLYVEEMIGRLGWERFKIVHQRVGKGQVIKEREWVL